MKKTSRILGLLAVDIMAILFSYYISLWIRFDGVVDVGYYNVLISQIVVIISIKVLIFIYFKLYRSLWEYASIEEMMIIGVAVFLANTATTSYLVINSSHLPRTIYILVGIFDLLLIGANRFIYRAIRRIKNQNFKIRRPKKSNVLLIGAGDAGAVVIKELRNHAELNISPVGILDDDPMKIGQRLRGVPIIGPIKMLSAVVEDLKIDEIIITIPSASKSTISDIVYVCNQTKARVKILPGVYELIDEKVTVNQIREVEIEDLLGRDPVHLDTDTIDTYIKGKTVLVTGGGGSIGSELCRQIARFCPKELIVLDIYENNAYDLQNELNSQYKDYGCNDKFELKVLIASVRDRERMRNIIKTHKPDVIFHAAAHKHVPLMEESPYEAVKNNIGGTYNLASLASEYNVDKFVLISTDKAVNPTNVMGATKRFCEMIIQSYAKVSKTEFVAVRFGNVLGSNGSVIPLFKKQIAAGGPVTVTHKDIIRYFMTIPEAAQLVLQAGAIANGGEIFILDMGKPVRIVDLAKDLIKLSGFEPEKDIQIVVSGLRPGEKLYEELLMDEEDIKKTSHEKIYIGKPMEIELFETITKVEVLLSTAELNDAELLRHELKRFIPTFKDNKEVNDKFKVS